MVEVALSRSANVTAATPNAEMHTAPKRAKVNLSTPNAAPKASVKKPLADPIVVPLATDVNPKPALIAQLAPNHTSVNCDARIAVSLNVSGGSGNAATGTAGIAEALPSAARTMLIEVRGLLPSIEDGRGTDVETRNGRTGELGRDTGGVGASSGVDAVEESSCWYCCCWQCENDLVSRIGL